MTGQERLRKYNTFKTLKHLRDILDTLTRDNVDEIENEFLLAFSKTNYERGIRHEAKSEEELRIKLLLDNFVEKVNKK